PSSVKVGQAFQPDSRRVRLESLTYARPFRHCIGTGPFARVRARRSIEGPEGEGGMKCLVTGAAGFIGSHLCERLLQAGHHVHGLDAFISYYPRCRKEANLAAARRHPNFTFHELDLRTDDLSAAL